MASIGIFINPAARPLSKANNAFLARKVEFSNVNVVDLTEEGIDTLRIAQIDKPISHYENRPTQIKKHSRRSIQQEPSRHW